MAPTAPLSFPGLASCRPRWGEFCSQPHGQACVSTSLGLPIREGSRLLTANHCLRELSYTAAPGHTCWESGPGARQVEAGRQAGLGLGQRKSLFALAGKLLLRAGNSELGQG